MYSIVNSNSIPISDFPTIPQDMSNIVATIYIITLTIYAVITGVKDLDFSIVSITIPFGTYREILNFPLYLDLELFCITFGTK